MDITQSFQLDVQDSCKDSDTLVMAQFEIVWSLNVVFPIIVSHLCQNQGTFYSVELTLWYFEYEFGLITRHALFWDINVTTWWICVTVLCTPSQTLSFFIFFSNSSMIRHSSLQGCRLHACPSLCFQHRSTHTASSSPSLLSDQQRRHFTESCSAKAGWTGGCSGLCH